MVYFRGRRFELPKPVLKPGQERHYMNVRACGANFGDFYLFNDWSHLEPLS